MPFRKRQPPGSKIELAKLIEEVASQLVEAQKNCKDQAHVLQLEECELEMAMAAEWKAGVGVKVYVFDLSGDYSKTNTNTIRVKFGPIKGSEPVYLAIDPAVIKRGPDRGTFGKE